MAHTALDQLGIKDQEVRIIELRMIPNIELVGGKQITTWIPTAPDGVLDLHTYNPTLWHFVLVEDDGSLAKDWKFAAGECDGKPFEGIAVSGCYETRFGEAPQHVIMDNFKVKPGGCIQKYSMLIEQVSTGKQIILDPGVGTSDRPGGGG